MNQDDHVICYGWVVSDVVSLGDGELQNHNHSNMRIDSVQIDYNFFDKKLIFMLLAY